MVAQLDRLAPTLASIMTQSAYAAVCAERGVAASLRDLPPAPEPAAAALPVAATVAATGAMSGAAGV
jgi:hypothetical protein